MSACTYKRSASMERRSKWRQAKAALTFAGAGLKATGRTLKVEAVDRRTTRLLRACLDSPAEATIRALNEVSSAGGKGLKRTAAQAQVLNASFRANPKPGDATIRALAEQCGITVRQVRTFFQNKRQRSKFCNLDGVLREGREAVRRNTAALERLRASNAGLQRENRGLQQSLDELNQNEGYLLVVVDSMLYDLENHGELKEDSVEAWTILQRSGYLQAAGC